MRLIDADDTIRIIKEHKTVEGEPFTERDKRIIEYVCDHIQYLQPTAYDVEAVVRELETKSTFYAHEAEGDKDMGYEYLTIRKYGISDGLDIAIEIVRGGRNE